MTRSDLAVGGLLDDAAELVAAIEDEIDQLLGGKTSYDIFHYGFTE